MNAFSQFALGLTLTFAVVGTCSAVAQPYDEARELAFALRTVVAVSTPRGPAPIRHCRQTPGEGDAWTRCQRRLDSFAENFHDAGRRHELDPWVLAAMASHESGLNPFAVSRIGARGIAQLHPRGVGFRSPFVRSPWVRRRCAREVHACQREVVELSAEHLRAWVDRCGDLKRALGGYNRGRCGLTPYVARVLRVHRRLVRASNEVKRSD